jgi:two-component system invasion response regulator UvrY
MGKAGSMIRLLIADDHAVVRKGLKQIVAETSDMVVSGEASNGQEVFELSLNDDWDVVLLDIGMPGRGGIDVLKQLKSEKPNLPVLVLSVYPEEQYAVRALKAGASGYLTKESAPEDLIAAIRKVVQGGKYVSDSLAERLAFDLGTDAERPIHERLSDREYQVVLMIAAGKTVKEIAAELSLSVKTISTNRTRALDKMGMKNNAEIARYIAKHGLID